MVLNPLDGRSTEIRASTADRRNRLLTWLIASINKDEHFLELELIILALTTGIIDAVSFPKFHAFTSNQTGNTVLFAVTAFSVYGTRQTTNFQVPAAHLACSLGFFCVGVFTAGQLANGFGSKDRRWWLLSSSAVQTALVLLAALLNLVFDTTDMINTAPVLVSIGCLAFASGAQVAMSRQLQMPEILTTQATAAYVDLFIDPAFFAPIVHGNRSRNRRAAFLLTLIVGIIKLMVLIMFCFNGSKVADTGHDGQNDVKLCRFNHVMENGEWARKMEGETLEGLSTS